MKIGTIASHSALNILSGAKKEGFETVLYLADKKRRSFYESFKIADNIVSVSSYSDFFNKVNEDTIIVPHGSFITYLSIGEILKSDIKLFGNKKLLFWESDREKKYQLLKESHFNVPEETKDKKEVSFPCIVKYDGAEGGKGYFIAESSEELEKNLDGNRNPTFQRFIVGTKVYTTFFYSNLTKDLEVFGTDIRYESDLDSKIRFDTNFSFQIVGNLPMVLRESLLIDYYEMGQNFVKSINTLLKTPMIGPFCLETIIDRNLDIYCFEFSGRIVAGTNIFIPSSPYSYLMFGKDMWMGRRIAREIRKAIKSNSLELILS